MLLWPLSEEPNEMVIMIQPLFNKCCYKQVINITGFMLPVADVWPAGSCHLFIGFRCARTPVW